MSRDTPRWSDNDIARLNRAKGAKKAARTRADKAAWHKHWREIDAPAAERVQEILNFLLAGKEVSLLYSPLNPQCRQTLKNGVTHGRLVEFLNGGRMLRVLPDGYKRPQDWHPGFWLLIC